VRGLWNGGVPAEYRVSGRLVHVHQPLTQLQHQNSLPLHQPRLQRVRQEGRLLQAWQAETGVRFMRSRDSRPSQEQLVGNEPRFQRSHASLVVYLNWL
jgi:hypothetical protein